MLWSHMRMINFKAVLIVCACNNLDFVMLEINTDLRNSPVGSSSGNVALWWRLNTEERQWTRWKHTHTLSPPPTGFHSSPPTNWTVNGGILFYLWGLQTFFYVAYFAGVDINHLQSFTPLLAYWLFLDTNYCRNITNSGNVLWAL